MKAAFFSVFALAAGVFASPVAVAPAAAARDLVASVDASVSVNLGNITDAIKVYTSAINTTMSSVNSVSLTTDQQTSLVQEIMPQLEGISSLLQVAVKTAANSGSDFTVGLSASTDIICKIEELVFELLYTVLAIVQKIGLGDVLLHILQLIMVSLGNLIRTIVNIVGDLNLTGVLASLNSILSIVLGAVSDVLGSDTEILTSVNGLLSMVTSVL